MGVGAGHERTILAGDIGSTFTKLVAVTGTGDVVMAYQAPTRREAIADGADEALRQVRTQLERRERGVDRLELCSSAGGGLRVVVVGLEPKLTLEAGRRASATAGARIVASWTLAELPHRSSAELNELAPDLVLLTGGTNNGAGSVIEGADELRRLAPELPVVVAANEATYAAVASAFGPDRVVRFSANLMPTVGHLEPASAQAEIQGLFVDHVIASVKLAERPAIAAAVRMPTPAAVLRAAEAIAESGHDQFDQPVIVDLGGATTDIHSVLAVGDEDRGYASSGLEPQGVTRTVEGDLGVRENAGALVSAARSGGWVDGLSSRELDDLERGAEQRSRNRAFLPGDEAEHAVDERLAQLATEIAIARHAGVLSTTLTASGAVLRKTGRDLRRASCVIATGGVFRHARRAGTIIARAWERVAARGGLVTPAAPVFVDRSYMLWAIGLLNAEHPATARLLLASSVEAAR